MVARFLRMWPHMENRIKDSQSRRLYRFCQLLMV